MNKITKAAIAGAAGVALLLGGAGTFALWNTADSVAGGTVSSGTLTISHTGAPTWRNISADVTAATINTSTFKIVPGDKIQFTQVVTITATGDDLKAVLSYDDTTITGTGIANAALKSALVPTLAVSGTGITAGTAANTFNVAPSATATTATVLFTLELPSTVTGTVGQTGTVDLSGFTLKLQQTR